MKHLKGRLLAIMLGLLIVTPLTIEANASPFYIVVRDENDSPFKGASVSIWMRNDLIFTGLTGVDGVFEFDVEGGAFSTIIVFADNTSTPGVDYLPISLEVVSSNLENLSLVLVPAASLVLEGDIQFVEAEELPLTVVYSIIDPTSDQVIDFGFPLVFSSKKDVQSSFLGIEAPNLLVPADTSFSVMVNNSILFGTSLVNPHFKVDEPGHFKIGKGERVVVDVRKYSIPFNIEVVKTLHARLENKILEMESLGFYLVKEMRSSSFALRLVLDAEALFEDDKYVESYVEAKKSYLTLRQAMVDLTSLYSDAALSIYILVVFLAFASTGITFLMVNKDSIKLLVSPAVYVITIVLLYLTYPGSVVVPARLFAYSTILALAASLTAAYIIPHLLTGRSRDGNVPFRNIIVSVFSLAKRNLRRRRLRFILTLTSVIVLVMSFVALTSFSESYGIIISRVSGNPLQIKGLMLRASSYNEEEPAFMRLSDNDLEWLKRQPESVLVSPKVENLPISMPITSLNEHPIYGMVGFYPEAEAEIINLKNTLIEGELPSKAGIMISGELREELGVEIGDKLILNGVTVKLKGVFDGKEFSKLRDLDGSTYIPKKWENLSQFEGDEPTFILTECEPDEIVLTHLTTALETGTVGIIRIDITVGDKFDVNVFTERLSLERGYKAWSSSADGIYLTRLGSYIEGKGLPLIVPWGIVVLNVVVTMLNSLYERKKEIHILSSVGLNPSQLSAIFIAEASIIGVIGGGVGYLLGLGLYRIMAFLQFALEVQQKVSAFWSLASIVVSMTAVLVGATAALKSSVIITPSLMRRWRIEEKPDDHTQPWEFTVPLRLPPGEVDDFIDFVVSSLESREDDPNRKTESIRISSEADGAVKRIDFIYRDVYTGMGRFYTKNTLLIEKVSDMEVVVKIKSYGDRIWAHDTGTMIRMYMMEWSTTAYTSRMS